MVDSTFDLKRLTDCIFFINGECRREDVCPFRHCRGAQREAQTCNKWPSSCRDLTCRYRHPITILKPPPTKEPRTTELLVNHPSQPQPEPSTEPKGIVSFFWDIENVPIPRDQMPFDIVQRIRQKLVVEPGLREESFACYCDSASIPQKKQLSLQNANVRIIHVPDRKPGASDRQIMLDLDRFERCYRPPATVVLISGDIDFVGKLSDMRHQARYHVIIIHNRPAKAELKATVNACYSWDIFTQQNVPSFNPISTTNTLERSRKSRPFESSEIRRASRSRNRFRRDSSPPYQTPPNLPPPSPPVFDVRRQPMIAISCPKCESQFETLQALRQHQTAKNHLFPCPTCGEFFVTQAALAQHQKDKGHFALEHACDQCSRRFSKREHLQQHREAVGHTRRNSTSSLNRLAPAETASSLTTPQDADKDPFDVILEGIEAIREAYLRRLAGR